MATRDLSETFMSIRQQSRGRRGPAPPGGRQSQSDLLEEGGEGGASDGWAAMRHTLPPVWVDTVDEVERVIADIQADMERLAKAHRDRLMVRFDDDSESAGDREIDALTSGITGRFRSAESTLKRLQKTGADPSLSGAERTVRNNIQRSLAKRLQELSMRFRNSQKDFLKRVQSQKSGGGSGAFDFLDSGAAGAGAEGAIDTGFNQGQMLLLEESESLVNDRDQEIQRIARSIEELATIFKELAVLVIDQGSILDRIDYNLEMVVERTRKGVEELVQADKHQKSARPLKCIVLLLVLIAIMIAILVQKHSGDSSS